MGTDTSWLVGGPQGSGVETGANIFSRVCAGMGYQIFGKREYYSNIKGEHSYFAVRVSDRRIRSSTNNADIMVAYDAETIFRHSGEVARGGSIIYDSGLDKTTTDDVMTLDEPFRSRIAEYSGSSAPSVSDIIDIARRAGAKIHPTDFRGILAEVATKTANPKLRNMVRMFNVLGVSLSLGYLRTPRGPLLEAVDSIFSTKPEVAKINREAAAIAYERGEKLGEPPQAISRISKAPHTMLVQGHMGTAIAKMVCGCRIQPYYPITPASDESVYLETNEILSVRGHRPGSTIVIQCEDEISAIGMTIGAALTGTRAATCTSGPGFSLMAEMLGWAGINEVPVVITLYQRSGPATGLPTRQGQDDLLFAINAGHGEFPRIVYASGDIEESFYDTARCFNYADVYQVPVIHMMDKFLASSVITCPRFVPEDIDITRGKMLEGAPAGEYKRFEITKDGISPRSKLGLEGGIFWNTGDESDEWGHITEDPVMRCRMMEKRLDRYSRIVREVPDEEQAVSYGKGDITVISWGSAKGPILDALDLLKSEGIRMGFVQVKMLNPFPADYVRFLLQDAKKIVDIEANYTGQLGVLMRQNLGRDPDHYILKYSGRSMTSTEVAEALRRVASGDAEKREVLMHGA